LCSQTIGVEFASKVVKVGSGSRRKRIKLQVWLSYLVPVTLILGLNAISFGTLQVLRDFALYLDHTTGEPLERS
jgi:hypothetical protein